MRLPISFMDGVSGSCLLVLLLAALVCLVRLLRGPHAADRVIALDLFSLLIAASLGALSLQERQEHDLVVALAIALVSFLATVAWSFYVRQQARQGAERGPGAGEVREP